MPHTNISATVAAPQFSAGALSRDEYYRLAESGIFAGKRVELIHGEIRTMSPIGWSHTVAKNRLAERLRSLFSGIAWVNEQSPLHLNNSAPEPDLAVIPGQMNDYSDHPDRAWLVVEVADHSLEFDTTIKAALYAAAAIPEYWMVDLRHRQVLVHRQPQAAPGGEAARYQSVTRHGPAEAVLPAAAPPGRPPIPVADLLP